VPNSEQLHEELIGVTEVTSRDLLFKSRHVRDRSSRYFRIRPINATTRVVDGSCG
jgi:hypothetical protein